MPSRGASLAVGRPESAVHLFAVAADLQAAMGPVPTADQRAEVERDLSAARETLGAETFTGVWAAGRALSLDEAVAEALAVAISPEPLKVVDRDNPGTRFGLTARELDVLRLMVERGTNQEIADRLFVSVRTVTSHVTSILIKLDVESCTGAAAHAIRHGLA